jgi:hypothetical protein
VSFSIEARSRKQETGFFIRPFISTNEDKSLSLLYPSRERVSALLGNHTSALATSEI